MKPIAYRIMEETEESYWWYRARRKILCGVITGSFPAEQIVDFGCGTGSTACALRDLGYRVMGADIAEAALSVCRLRGLATVDLTRERLEDTQRRLHTGRRCVGARER